MTALDIIVLLMIGGNAVIGLMRGFVCEALSLVALGLAVVAVRLFHAPVTGFLTSLVGTEGGAAILAFALVFGLSWFGGRLLARSVGKRTRGSALGMVDRVLGLGFGALRGLLIATVAFVGFAIVYDTLFGADADRPQWMRTSRSYPLLSASGRAMSEWLAERRASGGLSMGLGGAGDNAANDAGDAR